MLELSLNILDIAQNSISAKAKNITIIISLVKDILTITIKDDGTGMKKEVKDNVTDPFFTTRTTRKIGLGIPFFKDISRLCKGEFEINSKFGEGTIIKASFDTTAVDFIPLGNIEETIATLIQLNSGIDFVYKVQNENEEFIFDTKEIKQLLESDDLNNFELLEWIKEYINENQFKILRRSI